MYTCILIIIYIYICIYPRRPSLSFPFLSCMSDDCRYSSSLPSLQNALPEWLSFEYSVTGLQTDDAAAEHSHRMTRAHVRA